MAEEVLQMEQAAECVERLHEVLEVELLSTMRSMPEAAAAVVVQHL